MPSSRALPLLLPRRTARAWAVLGAAATLMATAAPPVPAAGPPGAIGQEVRGAPAPASAMAWGAAGGAGRAGGAQHRRDPYHWPTGAPAPVVEGFDPPAVAWGRGHRGVDLAAPEGSPVRSAGDGVVAFAGMVAGRPVVSVDHADGIRTTYEPVEPVVSAGQAVGRGEVIGTLLAGHRGDGVSALHWGARIGPKTYVNPLRLLQPPVIRLKPVEG
ncbi:murein hydrolase activator EnvC family protein [Actinomyces bowdenii]|nr:M23 family metallopeptidase [Actinomyces bowdenii]